MRLFRLICLLVSSVFFSNIYAIEKLNVEIEQAEFSGWQFESVHIDFDLSSQPLSTENVTTPHISISIDKLISKQNETFKNIKIACPLASFEHVLQFDLIECQSGYFSAKHNLLGRLEGRLDFTLDTENEKLEANITTFKLAGGSVDLKINAKKGEWKVDLKGRSLDVEKLKKLLASFVTLPNVTSEETGKINLQLKANGRGENLRSARINIRTFDLGFDGNSVAEELDAKINILLERKDEEWLIKQEISLLDGAVYIEPGVEVGAVKPGFLLEVGQQPITLVIEAGWKEARIQIDKLTFTHPDVIAINIEGIISPENNSPVDELSMSIYTQDLNAVFPTYLQPLLFGSGLDEIEIIGQMDLKIQLRESSITDFHLVLDDVYADDQASRFHIAGLNGDVRLNSDPNVKDSTMTWQGGSIYQVNIGASDMKLSSKGRSMKLREKMRIPIFDGELQVNDLEMRKLGLEDYSVRIESTLTPITLSEFTEAIGWPIMAGNISGEIPGVTYNQGDLTTEGRLRVSVFDGDITISHLWIEDLFDLIPTLYADIAIKNIDLGILTKTFEFGDITGRLDGYMNNLRLDNWEPVQFDAKLATPEKDDSRHRISQRAIDNITSIGGGGSDVVSRGILGVFEDFPYSKIGLSCRLIDSVCFMSGVEKIENGYYIVKRGFLPPWLNIKGYNDKVDWPELLDRLQNISETDSPTIE